MYCSKMNFIQSISICFSRFASFRGRASRSEYWWFSLFTLIYVLGVDFIFRTDFILFPTDRDTWIPYLVVMLGVLIPSLAVTVRRFHDIDKSGWNYLWVFTIVGIIPVLMWLYREGTKEVNRFGNPPDVRPSQRQSPSDVELATEEDVAQSFDYQLALQRSIIVWGGVSLFFDFAYAIYVMGTSGGAGSGLSITDILLPALFISTLFITLGFFYNLNLIKEERKCPKCSAAWSMLLQKTILTDKSTETRNRTKQERKKINNKTYHRDIFYKIDCTYSSFDEFHQCKKCRYEEIRKRVESSDIPHTKEVTAVGEWTWSGY